LKTKKISSHNTFGVLQECLSVFSSRDKIKLIFLVVVQSALSLLDLIGVAIVGVIAALSVNGVRSTQPGERVSSVLRFLNLENYSFQTQTTLLAVLAALLLIFKTVVSIILTRRSLYFLGRVSAEISEYLVKRLLNTSLLLIRSDTSQKTLYAITDGVTAITIGVVGSAAAALTDCFLLIVLGVGIGIFDPSLTVFAFIIFTTILVFIYKKLRGRIVKLSEQSRDIGINSSEWTVEILESYREAFVRNRRDYYSRNISAMRKNISLITAEQTWLPNISKYAIEITVTLGTIIIAALQFLTKDAPNAIGGLALFLAAATRIAPALLRIQQNLVSVATYLATARPTLELFRKLQNVVPLENTQDILNSDHKDFSPRISIQNVAYSYPGKSDQVVKNLSLTIQAGTSVAIVGASGAGKSTLVDLMLGILEPTAGEIFLSNMRPVEAISKYPGAIAYVPQDISIFNGTIRSNLGLGFDPSLVSDEVANLALKRASLSDFIAELPGGLDFKVGDRGSRMSGGQRQRLGIARALVTSPKLLILDEATSSLDGKTEFAITESLKELREEVTVVLIAHRLSTLREVDVVIYLEDGEIRGMGSFEEVRNSVPDFDHQAKLMGL
jgi:ABC-type multidrug transport system fused ATPase/permease subunit